MKLSFVATLALAATAVAQGGGGGGGDKKIPIGEPCKQDGTMGTCVTGYCNQPEDKNQGTCQKKN